MSKVRIYIFMLITILGLSSCKNSIFFRPRLSCEYKPNYGLVYVSTDSFSQYFMNYVDLYQLDTERFLINAYEKYTLFYLPDYLALGYVDTSHTLWIKDFNGSELFSIQLPWDFRMLEYVSKKGVLIGVVFDSSAAANRIAELSVTNGSVLYSQAIDAQYYIDTQAYFFDQINNIYYIGVKNSDSIFLLGWSLDERKLASKANLGIDYIRPKYNYLSQSAVGIVSNSSNYAIVSFSPITGEQKSNVELNLTSITKVIGFDQSRQNIVIGIMTDSTYNFNFYHINDGRISEIHSFNVYHVEDLLVWSSMSNKILKSD